MARDRDYGDHGNSLLAPGLIGTEVPEDAVGAGSFVLSIGLEDFFAVRTHERSELVGMETRVTRIYFEITESLANLAQNRGKRWGIFERRKLPICRGREFELALHG